MPQHLSRSQQCRAFLQLLLLAHVKLSTTTCFHEALSALLYALLYALLVCASSYSQSLSVNI